MKIRKLEKDAAGRYDLAEVPDKINEIIDLLNNSFITNDPDTIYGKTTLSSLSCDRLTPLTNETTCTLTVDRLTDMSERSSIYSNIKCPKCGAKYFEVGSSDCTAVYYPTIIKDGVNINPDRNQCTTAYTCCECGHTWKE